LLIDRLEAALNNFLRSKGFALEYAFADMETLLIPKSVTVITTTDFYLCNSLTQIKFATNAQLRTIQGLRNFGPIERVTIPASVCSATGFNNCAVPVEVAFAAGDKLQQLARLIRLVVSAPVEILGGLNDCNMLGRSISSDGRIYGGWTASEGGG
jgi:hypothetical protein